MDPDKFSLEDSDLLFINPQFRTSIPRNTANRTNPKLDKIDREILSELQSDGRMSNVDLAKKVGISAPPCLRRVRALEENGFINGFHANIDARALGFQV